MAWRCAWLLVFACSGHPPSEPAHPHGSAAPTDGGVTVVVPTGSTERECAEVVDHAIALHLAELRAQKPADQLPNDAEVAKLAAELRAEPGCRTLTRDGYRCGLAAKSLSELEACYATRSSSTSNRSVAPGGITPAAPRSP
jgi:hypothetical protein